MKTTTLLNRALFAATLIAASTAAFANGGGSGPRGAHNAPYPYADSRSELVVSATVPLVADTAAPKLPSAQAVAINQSITQSDAQVQQKTRTEYTKNCSLQKRAVSSHA